MTMYKITVKHELNKCDKNYFLFREKNGIWVTEYYMLAMILCPVMRGHSDYNELLQGPQSGLFWFFLFFSHFFTLNPKLPSDQR